MVSIRSYIFAVLLVLPTACHAVSFSIRLATPADLPAVQQFSLNSFTQLSGLSKPSLMMQVVYSQIFAQEAADMQSMSSSFMGFTAVANNAVVGYLSAQDISPANTVYARWLAVDPAFQNNGVAGALVQALLAVRPSTVNLYLATAKKNAAAQALYVNNGAVVAPQNMWAPYLYTACSPLLFVGYVFNQAALAALSTRVGVFALPKMK